MLDKKLFPPPPLFPPPDSRKLDCYMYRVASYTWPCVFGTFYQVNFPVYACTVALTGKVTLYKVPVKLEYLARVYVSCSPK